MTTPSFADIQKDTMAMIAKIKDGDPKLGAYLEDHIIFDEKNESMTYTGESEIIESILGRVIIG